MTSAQQLLDQHWDGSVPVNLEALLSRLGIALSQEALDPHAVRIERLAEGLRHVRVDAALRGPARQFALAHALGHIALGDVAGEGASHADTAASFSTQACLLEQRANRYALELLMPRRMVHYAIGKGSNSRS